MNRREFILSCGTAVLSFAVSGVARAGMTCRDLPTGLRECEVGIQSSIASVVADTQHASEWCWAACIEMVFTYYGHPVPQEQIVQQTWGSIVNVPGYAAQILADLNRPWVDIYGRPFRVMGDTFSANIVTAAQDLANNRPLIVATLGHAMLLTGLRYVGVPFTNQVQIESAIVRDPWPYSPRRHALSRQQWDNINLLVRIVVV